MTPRRDHFWPQGHNLNKLGRSPIGDATCTLYHGSVEQQISHFVNFTLCEEMIPISDFFAKFETVNFDKFWAQISLFYIFNIRGLVRIFLDVNNWYQIFTNVKNWYQILTHVKNRYKPFTSVKDWY